jgi:hypothetical protein
VEVDAFDGDGDDDGDAMGWRSLWLLVQRQGKVGGLVILVNM